MIRRLIILLLIVGCEDENQEYPQKYNYSLQDINSTSDTNGQIISPGFFQGNVTLHYFGHQY